jgi:nitrite reductase/ring-hydroxylating ferredoxin subunit
MEQYNWIKIAAHPKNGDPIIAPNTIARLTVKGKKMFLTYKNGQYYAGDSRCPHAGGALTNGWLNNDGDIVCPNHRYCFDLSTGKNTSGEGYYLPTYPVENRADGLYVGFVIAKKWWPW